MAVCSTGADVSSKDVPVGRNLSFYFNFEMKICGSAGQVRECNDELTVLIHIAHVFVHSYMRTNMYLWWVSRTPLCHGTLLCTEIW